MYIVYFFSTLSLNQKFSLTALLSYFGHKIVPHAQLWGNELLPVGGSFSRNRRWRGRCLLYRASRNQHPHVESASVSVHILCWGLRGSHCSRRRNGIFQTQDNLKRGLQCAAFYTKAEDQHHFKSKKEKEIDQEEKYCIHILHKTHNT